MLVVDERVFGAKLSFIAESTRSYHDQTSQMCYTPTTVTQEDTDAQWTNPGGDKEAERENRQDEVKNGVVGIDERPLSVDILCQAEIVWPQ